MSQLQITKLVNHIHQYVKNNTGDIIERYSSVSAIIGAVIGTQLVVPSVKSSNQRLHYQNELYPVAAKYISEINEAYDLDVDFALECAYLTWLDRYNVVHVPKVSVTLALSRLTDISSETSTSFDTKRLAALKEFVSAEPTSTLNNVFLELLNQLKEV